jgi:DNA segregation ATPase FtsK/SpoIIIE, S-DNA-T family
MARSRSKSRNSNPPPTWDERLINALAPWRKEIGGIILFMLAAVTLLALPGFTEAGWLGWWTSLLRQLFGWGAYPFCLSAMLGGLHVALAKIERPYQIAPAQVIGFELILLTSLPLSHQLTNSSLPDAYLGRGGGLVGWALSTPLLDFFGPFLTGFFYLSLLLYGVGLLARIGWGDILRSLHNASTFLEEVAETVAPPEARDVGLGQERPSLPPQQPQTAPPQTNLAIPPPQAAPAPAAVPAPGLSPTPTAARSTSRRSRRLPHISLLEQGGSFGLPEAEIERKKRIIEQTLGDFGIPAEVTEIRRGPSVTQFGVEPGYLERTDAEGEVQLKKIRIGQIAALQKDLALALAVSRLRIQAPIPGRGVVGVEVPNDDISMVRLRPIIESAEFGRLHSPLAVGLGRDVTGSAVAVDLARLPHLLIAGTTGSGKSVCLNAMIANLVFNNSPDELHLIMIDPKKVELIRFNGLPHLIGGVEVEADRAVGMLRWLTAEMDRRYETFAHLGARNILSYNNKAVGHSSPEIRPLPYITVFIDELADLMHTYPGDVERTLCRLAQMARATGIHLVVATQRPSTDVITGLIKANFPARLSFSVASSTDSRVILDSVGAEQLLGKGDMLFLSPEASAPVRVQGVFVDDEEVGRIVTHWHNALPDFEPMAAPWESLIAKYALLDETDPLLETAIEIAKQQDNISTSLLQRRLRVGFPRAARIMEYLHEMGLVEDPETGGKTRRTLVDEEDDPLDDILFDAD